MTAVLVLLQALIDLRSTHAELMARSSAATQPEAEAPAEGDQQQQQHQQQQQQKQKQQQQQKQKQQQQKPPQQPSRGGIKEEGGRVPGDPGERGARSSAGTTTLSSSAISSCASTEQLGQLAAEVAELQASVHLLRSELALGLGQLTAVLQAATGGVGGSESVEADDGGAEEDAGEGEGEQELVLDLELRVGGAASLAAGSPVKVVAVPVVLKWGDPVVPVSSGKELRWALRRALAAHPDPVSVHSRVCLVDFCDRDFFTAACHS